MACSSISHDEETKPWKLLLAWSEKELKEVTRMTEDYLRANGHKAEDENIPWGTHFDEVSGCLLQSGFERSSGACRARWEHHVTKHSENQADFKCELPESKFGQPPAGSEQFSNVESQRNSDTIECPLTAKAPRAALSRSLEASSHSTPTVDPSNPRHHLTPTKSIQEQRQILESAAKDNDSPLFDERLKISTLAGLTLNQVDCWFQHYRMINKKSAQNSKLDHQSSPSENRKRQRELNTIQPPSSSTEASPTKKFRGGEMDESGNFTSTMSASELGKDVTPHSAGLGESLKRTAPEAAVFKAPSGPDHISEPQLFVALTEHGAINPNKQSNDTERPGESDAKGTPRSSLQTAAPNPSPHKASLLRSYITDSDHEAHLCYQIKEYENQNDELKEEIGAVERQIETDKRSLEDKIAEVEKRQREFQFEFQRYMEELEKKHDKVMATLNRDKQKLQQIQRDKSSRLDKIKKIVAKNERGIRVRNKMLGNLRGEDDEEETSN